MARKQRRFFKGWYFKHRIGGVVFAVIAGIAMDEAGGKEAFVQTISARGARYFSFPFDFFEARDGDLPVAIGENTFSREGIRLSLDGVKAEFAYGPITELKGGDIMGPFGRVPFMECFHGVLSLKHAVDGHVEEDGVKTPFDGGSGYIEMDWGRSFPRKWVWLECHDFEGQGDASLMLAVAEIPFLGIRFTGIIGVVMRNGEQVRIATYRGARIAKQDAGPGHYRIALKQGRLRAEVKVNYDRGFELRAPLMGKMSRVITEVPCCEVTARIREGDKEILGAHGRCCGFERVEE